MSNLIPISRKEQYLSKIDGMTNKSPDKTYTKEESFFSEILGEALHKPVLETRYEMYLAKIAGREIGIPYPETRLERFLARAAGMNVETPAPITKEEIYWSNYTAVMEFEIENVPPLTYKAIEGTLKNYRIYGNTVNGESVGDRTANLLDTSLGATANPSRTLITSNGFFPVIFGETYTTVCSFSSPYLYSRLSFYNQNGARIIGTDWGISGWSVGTAPENAVFARVECRNYAYNVITDEELESFSKIMVVTGSTVPETFAPYGFQVPVTVEGKNLFNFDEPNVKGYDFEKQSEGVYYIADTGSLYNANRYKLDTETGKQYVLKGVIDNTNISTQLSGYLEGTENPVEGQIFKTGNINIIFTANGKTTLTIFGYKANQSGTVTNLQVYDISITDDTYEPYQPPVTTNLYLPEQIRKVGDEAEYIDYGEQKQHRVGAEDIDVTLPALPTIKGTNVLSVGTEVQPSKVYVKYKGERQ